MVPSMSLVADAVSRQAADLVLLLHVINTLTYLLT